ncbi:MAG: hypothetical protein OXN21_06580, partial [Chloroflexota bacterium]|nr:hypothetical protein [Chloroflexota bacterium]
KAGTSPAVVKIPPVSSMTSQFDDTTQGNSRLPVGPRQPRHQTSSRCQSAFQLNSLWYPEVPDAYRPY